MRRQPVTRAGFEVQARPCATCIYHPATGMDVAALEQQIADPRMPGFFRGYRACHHASNRRGVCCRGFWDRHKDHFAAGQLAQRLRLVVFVTVDRFTKRRTR